ncbi:MAG: NFACT family protein [Nanoarchaeota archaeon]
MARELSSIDIRYLVRELAAIAPASRIDKVYAPQPHELVLQLRRTGKGKALVRFIVPDGFYIASAKDDMPERPSSWCALLRKTLEGAKVIEVLQPASERIVQFVLGRADTTFSLYLELYGKGNIIVTDEKGIAHAVLHEITHKDRAVTRGTLYALPKGMDVFNLSAEAFRAVLRTSDKKNISTALSSSIGIGSLYAKELCLRAGVDPQAQVNDDIALRTYDALRALLATPAQPNIVTDGTSIPLPVVFLSSGKQPMELIGSFSNALERTFRMSAPAPASGATKALETQRLRLAHSIEAQDAAVKKLELAAATSQRAGELLYEHYAEFKTLLEQLALVRKKGEVDAFLKHHKKIVAYNPTTGDITLELQDSA